MKQLTALVLVLVLSLSCMATASAAGSDKIADINYDYWDNAQDIMNSAAEIDGKGDSVDLMNMRISPGSEVRIYLTADMFADGDGNVFAGDGSGGISKKDISNGKVSLSKTRMKNSNLFEEISLEYDSDRKTGYIKMEIIDPFVGSGKRTVSGAIRLKINGSIYEETEFTFNGQVSNTEVAISAGTDYVDATSGDIVVNPDTYIQGIQVQLANGVTIRLNMHGNRKYYARCDIKENPGADNAEIVLTYALSYNNMDTTGTAVLFDLPELYYVYNGGGEYLGTTKDELVIAKTYYLTTQHVEELEVAGRSENGSDAAGSRGGR